MAAPIVVNVPLVLSDDMPLFRSRAPRGGGLSRRCERAAGALGMAAQRTHTLVGGIACFVRVGAVAARPPCRRRVFVWACGRARGARRGFLLIQPHRDFFFRPGSMLLTPSHL